MIFLDRTESISWKMYDAQECLILALDGCLEFYARKYFRVIKSYFGNGSA